MRAPDTDSPVIDLWTGISLEIAAIVELGSNTAASVAAIRKGQADRHEAIVKSAADELARIGGQMQTLSAHLASVLARHAARQSRVRT